MLAKCETCALTERIRRVRGEPLRLWQSEQTREMGGVASRNRLARLMRRQIIFAP
jgi:hypothetical protein